MKAAIYTHYGPPEVIQILNVPKPWPKDDEVLIKVQATTVNRTDCGFRSANYFVVRFFSGLINPKNAILGCEFSGEIEAVGSAVTSFHPGDKVFGFNDKTWGGHAEYMTMPEDGPIATMPSNVSFEEAAPICEGAHYALCDLRAAKTGSGQQVLINGASGGIGSAAVQLARYFGAEVTAVCNTKNLELVKSLGATKVIDYITEDFTSQNHTFDLIFDAVGKSSFGQCKPILKGNGIYVSTELGPRYENPFLALRSPYSSGKRVIFPLPTISKNDVVFLKELVENGYFKPVIDHKYPLEQIVEAYRYVETGQKTGKVVITVGHTS